MQKLNYLSFHILYNLLESAFKHTLSDDFYHMVCYDLTKKKWCVYNSIFAENKDVLPLFQFNEEEHNQINENFNVLETVEMIEGNNLQKFSNRNQVSFNYVKAKICTFYTPQK